MMNKKWVFVIVAAMFEVLWVIGLKHADDILTWTGTVIAIFISFSMLIYAGKILPASTAYAVYVGIGSAGTVLAEMIFFGVSFQWSKIALIALLLVGIIGLKIVTDKDEEGEVSWHGSH